MGGNQVVSADSLLFTTYSVREPNIIDSAGFLCCHWTRSNRQWTASFRGSSRVNCAAKYSIPVCGWTWNDPELVWCPQDRSVWNQWCDNVLWVFHTPNAYNGRCLTLFSQDVILWWIICLLSPLSVLCRHLSTLLTLLKLQHATSISVPECQCNQWWAQTQQHSQHSTFALFFNLHHWLRLHRLYIYIYPSLKHISTTNWFSLGSHSSLTATFESDKTNKVRFGIY